jgi:aminopeptidase 2
MDICVCCIRVQSFKGRNAVSKRGRMGVLNIFINIFFCALLGMGEARQMTTHMPGGPSAERSKERAGEEVGQESEEGMFTGLLPRNLLPVKYDLHIVPDFKKSTFKGTVLMHLNAVDETDRVVFNSEALSLDLEHIAVKVGGEDAEVRSVRENKDEQQVVVDTIRMKRGDKVSLALEFSGEIKENMIGFYKSSYISAEGKKEWLYSTQFQSTDARRAFPCMDEPFFRAKFSISITAPKKMVVLSNMNEVKRIAHGSDEEIVFFAETPAMSTYLVAYVIGDLAAVGTTSRGRDIKVFAIRGSEQFGEYALNVAKHCLEFFEEYFAYEYPLPKLDMVAIPEFSAGAMENWGLVTYRSISLLYDEKNSSLRIKANIAATVCHELAHQWFGNLVTMRWWNDLWLNEGFATWAGALAVDGIKDKIDLVYDIWGEFTTDDIERGRDMDGKLATHPIEVEVRDGGEISSIFGAIAYSKGASLIYMLANHIGAERFRDGLRKYISENAYKNTATDHLWQAVQAKSSGTDSVKKIMDNWTKQCGFPVVHVTEMLAEAAQREDSENLQEEKAAEIKVVIRQERYLPESETAPTDVLWHIPLSVRVYGDHAAVESVDIFKEKQRITSIDPSATYVFNTNGSGFYRVKYSDDIYKKKILVLLEQKRLSALDRLSIVMDLSKFVEDTLLDVGHLLSIVGLFRDEENYRVLSTVAEAVASIKSVFNKEKAIKDKIERELVQLLDKRGDIDLFKAESDLEKRQMNTLIFSGLANISGTELQKRLSESFDADPRSLLELHPDFRGAAFSSIAKFKGKEAFGFLLGLIRDKKSAEDVKLRAMLSIGMTREESLFGEVFKLFVDSSEDIKNQDKMRLVYSMSYNLDFREKAYYLFKESFGSVMDTFKDNKNHVSRFIESLCSVQSDEQVASDLETFLGQHRNDTALRMGIDKAIGNARNNVAFYKKNLSAVQAWASS